MLAKQSLAQPSTGKPSPITTKTHAVASHQIAYSTDSYLDDHHLHSQHSPNSLSSPHEQTSPNTYRRGAFSSSPTAPNRFKPKPRHKESAPPLTLSPVIRPLSTHNDSHKRTPSFPDLFARLHRKSTNDLEVNNAKLMEQQTQQQTKSKRKSSSGRMVKWKRAISSDNLMNSARAISSAKSKAMIKLKHKHEADIVRDTHEVKQCKKQLLMLPDYLNDVLSICNKLHSAQSEHLQKMQAFSSTIHSTIDLGQSRRGANQNYFGQYLKMMASTMHCVQSVYNEHTVDKLREFMMEPLEQFLDDPLLQNCINLRHQYSKTKNSFNENTNSNQIDKVELEQVREQFVDETQRLLAMREDKLMFKFMDYEQSLFEFAIKQAQYIKDKRVIVGYDEMKAHKSKIQNQVKNEMLHIETDEAFHRYFAENVVAENEDKERVDEEKKEEEEVRKVKQTRFTVMLFHRDTDEAFHRYFAENVVTENENEDEEKKEEEEVRKVKQTRFTVMLFHRDKFPPSNKFLLECFAPLCANYNLESFNDATVKFIIVHHKCAQILDKYEIAMFPTCLVFDGKKPSSEFKEVVGNSAITQNELKVVIKRLREKIKESESDGKEETNAVDAKTELAGDDDDNHLKEADDNCSD
eukprot:CAMPEP_0197075878 /NCGR_PEP_ID=MMETSP1384-20130603/211832_1 /TAXON_ID=29189 /ORGANISM="Ammonia sp." /LENGTH=634 /DNA_ID=CAMNT_0042514727 /DNA_START=20 /DNA_END=1924 /DNA_ORIENTATION=+